MTYEEAQRICQDETRCIYEEKGSPRGRLVDCGYTFGPGVLDMTEEELRAEVRAWEDAEKTPLEFGDSRRPKHER